MKMLYKIHKILNNKGFSLLELVMTLGIFSILLVTVTNILAMNLKVSNQVKARSFAREESAFFLNILKKDIRNAESITLIPAAGAEPEKIQATVRDDSGTLNTYSWELESITYQGNNYGRFVRKQNMNITYATPSNIHFKPHGTRWFTFYSQGEEGVIKISMDIWTRGMKGNPFTSPATTDFLTKQIVISTRNFTI